MGFYIGVGVEIGIEIGTDTVPERLLQNPVGQTFLSATASPPMFRNPKTTRVSIAIAIPIAIAIAMMNPPGRNLGFSLPDAACGPRRLIGP